MMMLLWFASFVTLVVLAIAFIVALVVRCFTKRRPPLVTWRVGVVAALAAGVLALGFAGLAADNRRENALWLALVGLDDGADMDEVEKRLGMPDQRHQRPFHSMLLSMPLGDQAKMAAEIWVYNAGVWYSPYQPPVQIVVCFDEFGRLFYQTACD